MSDDVAAAHALVDELCGTPGPPSPAARRWVRILLAQDAALVWVHQAGATPTPPSVTAALDQAAADLADPDDTRDPRTVLIGVAVTVLTALDRGAA